MPKNVELLLTESVEALGIVGDVVKVRTGYARNFLLPRGFATEPSEAKIKELAAKRAEAERHLAELRKVREDLVKKLDGYELHLTRSCNDQGILYGAVTQQEIAKALGDAGFGVRARDVRLGQTIKRVDTYEVHIKFEADLEAVIKLWVMPDRKLDLKEEPAETEAPSEGGEAAPAGDAPADGKPEAKADKPHADKRDHADKAEKKKAKKPREEGDAAPAKEPKADKAEPAPAKAGGWGKPASKFDFNATGGSKPEKEAKADKKGKGK